LDYSFHYIRPHFVTEKYLEKHLKRPVGFDEMKDRETEILAQKEDALTKIGLTMIGLTMTVLCTYFLVNRA
jgi:hypothetical protein